MLRCVVAALALLALLSSASAQNAKVVQTCGTLSPAYVVGATRQITINTSGETCPAGGVTPPASPITPSLVASVSSCTAPCSIFVDATATTAPGITQYPFHDLHYTINYGDPGSGSYGASNGVGNFSRNVTYGSLGAHVFETPGVYTITLTVRAPTLPQGTWSSKHLTTQVTITDPAVTFPTTATKCFSTSGNFTGCPADASQITEDSWVDIINGHLRAPNVGSNILLRCGETFTFSTAPPIINAAGPGTVATYGGCGKAILRANGVPPGQYFMVIDRPAANWSFVDLKLDPDGSTNETLSGVFTYGQRTLFLRLETIGTNRLLIYSAIDIGSGARIDQVTFAENIVVSGDVAQVGGGVYIDGLTRMAVLGNTISNDAKGQHVWRSQDVTKAVYFNNNFSSSGGTKAVFTIHGNARVLGTVVGQWVFGDNWAIGGDRTGGLVSLRPQHGLSNEPIEDVIFERNFLLGSLVGGGINCCPMDIWMRRLSLRNNIYNSRAKDAGQTMIAIHSGLGGAPPSSDIWTYYNSSYFPGTTAELTRCFHFTDTATSALKNNLCYAPNAGIVFLSETNSVVDDTNNTLQSQVKLVSPNWFGIGGNMTIPQGFALNLGSYGIGTGAFVPIYDDILLTPRGSQFDMGAVKFQ